MALQLQPIPRWEVSLFLSAALAVIGLPQLVMYRDWLRPASDGWPVHHIAWALYALIAAALGAIGCLPHAGHRNAASLLLLAGTVSTGLGMAVYTPSSIDMIGPLTALGSVFGALLGIAFASDRAPST